jgi:PIN domain nuclease of toxin-antitoxin system
MGRRCLGAPRDAPRRAGAETVEEAELWRSTRHLSLSLGDRACLALAGRLDLPALTADRAWVELDVGVDVRAIR